jgi:hypothetical protein
MFYQEDIMKQYRISVQGVVGPWTPLDFGEYLRQCWRAAAAALPFMVEFREVPVL